jgi:hypothetical protein
MISINCGYYYRNYNLSKSVLGNTDEHYFNEEHSISSITLSLVKNTALHFGIFPIDDITTKAVVKLHELLNERINDPKTNWNGMSFRLERWSVHEDLVANVFQMTLSLVTLVIIFCRFKRFKPLILLLLLFLEFLIFCIVLKWQPWHSRLQMPIFFLFAFSVAYMWDHAKLPKLIKAMLASLMLIFSALIVLFNPSRPYLTVKISRDIKVTDNRFKKYFVNKFKYENEYRQLILFLKMHKKGELGIIMGGDNWEYPLYTTIFSSETPKTDVLPHLNVSNLSKNATWNDSFKKEIKYIISIDKQDTLHYNNSIFYKT